ncbi:MAG: hypothetical protein WBC98_02425, partial [Candidatus Zixiibacteriota bacterium]
MLIICIEHLVRYNLWVKRWGIFGSRQGRQRYLCGIAQEWLYGRVAGRSVMSGISSYFDGET